MKRTARSYFKRTLVVFMAIVMVFTYMPSTMGAETAWADTPTVINDAAAFAAMEPSGNYALGGDITISQPYDKAFSGTFDGNGHTVTLAIDAPTSSNVGLFSTLGGGATVKNVITAGEIQASSYNNVGGIAGNVDSDGDAITIERCKNKADITGTKCVGGILGYGYTNNIYVVKCANAGAIVASRQGGGIAGNIEGTFTVEDCYNRGTVSNTNSVAGILGRAANGVSVKRCYSTGSTGDSGFAIIGSASNRNEAVTIEKCYALSGSAGNFIYSSGIDKDDESEFKTEEYMQSETFVSLLGDAFMFKAGDYPALAWETPTASVSFNITPANAQLTITKIGADEGSAVYTGTGGSVALPVGQYSYTVSCEGYTSETGTVSVTDVNGTLTASQDSVSVSLTKDDSKWGEVTFEVSGSTSYTIMVKDSDGNIQSGNQNVYELLNGKTYSYTVTPEEESVESYSGQITVNDDVTEKVILKGVSNITIIGSPKTEFYVGDKLDTNGLKIKVTYTDNTEKELTEGFEVTGFDSSAEAESQTLTVSYKGKSAGYVVTIKKKPFPSAVFNALAGKAAVTYSHNDKFTGIDGEEFIDDAVEGALKSNSADMNNSEVTVTIKFDDNLKASKLKFWYKTSSEKNYDYLKINNENGKSISGETGWTEKELTVTGGETVTLAYVKDSSGKSGSDCVWLKDFTLEQLYSLTISAKDADGKAVSGAAVVLTDADENVISGENGIYSVTAGTYTYTVSAFGYKSESGTITIGSEDITKDITLTKLASHKATFNVTLPDDLKGTESEISIMVKKGNAAVNSEDDGSYSLPAGEYTYTITHPKCETAEGSFTIADADVTENVTLIRKLVFSDFFDGLSASLTATDDAAYPFKAVQGEAADGSDNYLESTNKEPSSGYGSTTTSTLTLEAKAPAKISFDAWYSTYGSDSSYSNYGLLLKKNGVQFAKKYGESSDWENVSVKVTTQDKIAIAYAYYKSYYDSTPYKYCIRLKKFTVTPLTALTFTDIPEGAVITVKQDGNVVEAETDGSYLLEKGSYTYSVTAFGYRTIEDAALEVSESDVTSGVKTKTVTMTPETKQSVTFAVTKADGIEADATVIVKYADAVKATLTKDNYSCELPAGTYSYTITCEGCETETGEFTVDAEAKTVEVMLEKTLIFEDFFTGFDGRADITNDTKYQFKPVKEGSNKYLQSSNQTNGTESKITFTFTKPTRISFDYMVSELGNTSTDSNYGLKISRNEKLLDRYQEISSEWTSYEVFADAGDTITISYSCYKNYSGEYIDDENLIKLKNFEATPLTKVSFSGLPENAKVSIASGEQTVETIDGKFLLEKGSYTYSVKAFGYKDIAEESLTVDGTKDEDTVTLTMVLTSRVTMSFQTTPSDATIVVKNEAGETMTALEENANSYSLPANEKYFYEVSADNYVSKSGYFTADTAKAIKVTLAAAGDAWDGTTTKEPTLKNGVYQISSAEELAWFAAKVSEDAAINAILTANINLNNQTWTSIGSNSNQYTGAFDGNGKTISGLKGTQGLFDTIGVSSTIKNLNLVVDISGDGGLGGVCGTLYGSIENSIVSGKIANKTSYRATGGIAGIIPKGETTSGRIIGCVNKAEIQSTYTGYGSSLNIGGIVGYSYGTVENSYNIGNIKAKLPEKTGVLQNKAIGGVAGQLYAGGILKNSYTIGAVTGPEAGIGSVIGINSGTVENTYVLENICAKTIAANNAQTGVSIQEKTAEAMRESLFAYTLGDAYNQDSEADSINNGFPVLKWQGGSAPSVPQFEKDVEEALKAIGMKDLKRAEELEAEKRAVDAEIEAEGGLEALKKEYEGLFDENEEEQKKEFLDNLTMEYFYELYGINLEDDGTLKADTDNKYQIKKEMRLLLPVSAENGAQISWTSSNKDLINPTNGTVKLPTSEKAEVILTASAAKGEYTNTRTFTFVIWPENTEYADVLKDIKEKAERTGTFIQPLQLYNHTNITQAMQQWIARQEYPTLGIDKEGIKVEFLDAGTQTMPKDDTAYIGENGALTYFAGTQNGYGWKYALYDGVKFKLTYHGEETEVSIRAHIGWDTAYVEGLLEKAMERVTWDSIKGSNTNSAAEKDADGWWRTVVDGGVTGDLILPYKLDKFTYASIKWVADDPTALYATDNNDGTCTAALERPAIGQGDKKVTLKGIATFDFWDDYTIEELTSANGKADPAESFKLFDITIPENTTEQIDVIQAALEKYPTLLRDFSDKDKEIDTAAVTKDIQMVRPAVLEEEGIMTDRYNQKVKMTSSDTDVLEFNGYHAIVYRPLPGEPAKTVSYTIQILDRRNNALLGEKTFEMTILPLTQKEIDDAAAWMNKICTEEVYWNGIKGENTSKDNVTKSLEPFEEILNNNGEAEYVRGAINITFAGIEVDDLPGYDAMKPQPWREFRSSKHSVVACETLLITQPEYNTKVKIDSALSYGEFSKYWEKFAGNEKYKDFEQFYKRPVAVTVTIIGRKGIPDPTPQPTAISVTVSVDGKGTKGFAATKNIKVSGLDPDTSTAWDAVTQALKTAGYKHSGVGDYIASVTDPKGITLSDTDTSKTGWLYTVNGKLPNVYMGSYYLLNNDDIVLYYTPDYTTEPGLGGWSSTDDAKDVVTNGKTGETVTESKTDIKVSEKINADGTKEKVAEIKVSADNQKEILKQAKENKSKEIILSVSKDAVKDATKADVTLDKSFIDSIVKDTDAKLTIKTPFGDKTYTQEELKAMSEAATGSTVTLAIEKTTEEPADDAAAKLEKAKSIVKDMKLVARSSKTAKKNIKAVLRSDEKVTKSVKELKDLGFTVKYRFYRSTKKSASYKSTVTKNVASYTNTSGKKGTRYFYKVQVRVYDENGKFIAKTALKQCKYASRIR